MGSISAREFVEAVTGDILGSRIFVFTPKGEVWGVGGEGERGEEPAQRNADARALCFEVALLP